MNERGQQDKADHLENINSGPLRIKFPRLKFFNRILLLKSKITIRYYNQSRLLEKGTNTESKYKIS